MIMPDLYWEMAWVMGLYLLLCAIYSFGKAGAEFATCKDDFMASLYSVVGIVTMAILLVWMWINWTLIL